MCMCTCVQVRGQRQTSSQPLSTAGFKMSLLLELTGCAWLHWLASKPQRSLVYLPSPEIIGVYCCGCAFDMGAGNPSTVPHVCGKCFTDSHFVCCLVVHSPCRFLSGLFPMFWSLILLLVCSRQYPSVCLRETGSERRIPEVSALADWLHSTGCTASLKPFRGTSQWPPSTRPDHQVIHSSVSSLIPCHLSSAPSW